MTNRLDARYAGLISKYGASNEINAIYGAIELAAYKRQYSIQWSKPIHPQVEELLKGDGYKIASKKGKRDGELTYIISWAEPAEA